MSSEPITSVFNDGYIAEAYESYAKDPSSVDESWRQFFRFAEGLSGVTGATPSTAPAADGELLRKVAGAASLVDSIRAYGHLEADTDPLGNRPPGTPELTPEFHGLSESDLEAIPGAALRSNEPTAAAAVKRLRSLYSARVGFEFDHLGDAKEREWLREEIESGRVQEPLSADEKKAVLRRLTEQGRVYEWTEH